MLKEDTYILTPEGAREQIDENTIGKQALPSASLSVPRDTYVAHCASL